MSNLARVVFQPLQSNGTSEDGAPIYLSIDEGNPRPAHSFYRRVPNGVLDTVVVECFRFIEDTYDADEAGRAAYRLALSSEVIALRQSLLYNPPPIVALPRGKAAMPNIVGNWGSLRIDNNDGSPVTYTDILAKCFLIDLSVIDDEGASGIKLQLTFARVDASLDIAGA